MDLIESQQWKKAYKVLDSKWWNDYDEKDECARGEYIGLVEKRGGLWFTYADLIIAMVYSPDKYKVVSNESN